MGQQALIPAPLREGTGVEHSPDSPQPMRAQRILVADDNEFVRHLLSAILSDAGFEAHAAADGEQAWEALQQQQYDLLLTDNEMPRLPGIKLIERIRKAGMRLPIIVVSGSASADTARDNPQLQIAAVLPKPFTVREPLPLVTTALRASGEGAAAGHKPGCPLQTSPQPIH